MLDAFPIYHWFHNGNPYSGAEQGMRYVITPGKKADPADESGKRKIEFLTVSPLCIRQLHPKSVYFSFLLCYNSDFQNCIMRRIYSNASRRLRASSSIWGLRAM